MVDNLIINEFIIFVSIILLRLSTKIRSGPHHTAAFRIGLWGGITSILCMLFVYHPTPEITFDIRYVPFTILTLLWGWIGFATAGTLIVGFIAIFHPIVLWENLVIIIFLGLVCMAFRRIFHHYENIMLRSLCLALLTTSSYYFSYLTLHPLPLDVALSKLIFIYGIAQFVGFCLTLMIIRESMRRDMLLSRLAKQEQLEMIAQLAASIAHEVRNPLTTIVGFLQLFVQKELTVEQMTNYANVMLEEAKRANVIISDYLTMTKPSHIEIELIDCTKIISRTSEVLFPYANLRQVIINVKVQESPLFIKGSEQQLMQALVNILKNGIEASFSGSILLITCEKYESQVHIKVTDSGKGMTPEEVNQLGRPFGSRRKDGTGLGLFVSYNLIELMNGYIQVTSLVGEGTTFTLIFDEATPS